MRARLFRGAIGELCEDFASEIADSRCTGVVPDGQNLPRIVVDRGETPRIAKSAE